MRRRTVVSSLRLQRFDPCSHKGVCALSVALRERRTSEKEYFMAEGRTEMLGAGRAVTMLGHNGFCRVFNPTGRIDLGFTLLGGWPITLHELCERLCRAERLEAGKSS